MPMPFARQFAAAARRLAPVLRGPADRWLLCHAPLLWRSRLVPVALLSALLSAAAWVGVGQLRMGPADAWTADQTDALVGYTELLALIAVGGCLVLALRFSAGPLRPGAQLRSAACLSACAICLLLPPQVLRDSLNRKVAAVMPRDAFLPHLELHRAAGFWCHAEASNGPTVDGRQVAKRLPEAAESLRLFGVPIGADQDLSDQNSWETAFRPAGTGHSLRHWCLTIEIIGGSRVRLDTMIRPRLENIDAQQRAMAGQPGFVRVLGHLGTWGLAVLPAVLLFGWLMQPGWWLARRWPRLASALARWRAPGLPQVPAWARKLDRRLLRRRPVLWATEIHRFALTGAGIGLLLYLAVSGLLQGLGPDAGWHPTELFGSVGGVYFIFLTLAAASLVWLLAFRHHRVPATSDTDLRRLVLAFMVVCLLMPALAFAVLQTVTGRVIMPDSDPRPTWLLEASLLFGQMAGMPVLAAALAANFVGMARAAGAAALGVPLMLFPWLLDEIFDLGNTTSILCGVLVIVLPWLALQIFLKRRARAGRKAGLLAEIGLCLSPAAIASFCFMVSELGDELLDWGSDTSEILLSVSLTIVAPLAFLWLLMPSLRVLAHAHVAPQPE